MGKEKEILVFGHRNPDTDAVCSAIAYAYLKNQADAAGDCRYIPARLGEVNGETAYVLDRFKTQTPRLLSDVRLRLKDVEIGPGQRIRGDLSIRGAWELLKETEESTLAVTDDEGKLLGLLTIGDIARSIMEVHGHHVLADAKTPFENIAQTIEAQVLSGDLAGKTAAGKVIVAAANPDQMESFIEPGDIVVLGDRYEAQLCALEMQAGCLIICLGSEVDEHILETARERGTIVLRTSYDTYIAARLLNESIPAAYFMVRDHFMSFELTDTVSDIRGTIASVRHRAFPVLDEKGRFSGILTRQDMLQMEPRRVILVDHNERSQSADGIEEAGICEIIDHHKIGSVVTGKPILYRAQPVGCTSTIIYMMYQEQGIPVPGDIAGLMCSAIISDTLLYRSPTCTPVDIRACQALAEIAGIDPQEHAKAMFRAGSDFSGKSEEDILYQDFKRFETGDTSFGVGQVTSMDGEELAGIAGRMQDYMEKSLPSAGLDMMFLMMTDILDESTVLVCAGSGAEEKITKLRPYPAKGAHALYMKDVVSRKKQVLPLLMEALA